MLIYALIMAGIVKNTIVVSDLSVLSNYSQYDCVVEVDQMIPQPGVGWRTSDCVNFTRPPAPSPRPSPSPSHS